jgi:hypothetical protein
MASRDAFYSYPRLLPLHADADPSFVAQHLCEMDVLCLLLFSQDDWDHC